MKCLNSQLNEFGLVNKHFEALIDLFAKPIKSFIKTTTCGCTNTLNS
jgi:hypothetical protein